MFRRYVVNVYRVFRRFQKITSGVLGAVKADHDSARPVRNALGVPFPELDAVTLRAW
jgi:hypothetical protein